jgi:hypothetical protein
MKKMHRRFAAFVPALVAVGLISGLGLLAPGCASDTKAKNHAMEMAARYWQDKAYPGKSYDVQVTEAAKNSDGTYQVKGIVDGETRVGQFNPESETFSEGYYALSHEREKQIAELEQKVKYLTEKVDGLEKENYKLKVKLGAATGKPVDEDAKQ